MAKSTHKHSADKTSVAVNWGLLLRWSWALVLLGSLAGGAFWGVLKLQQPDVLPLKVVRIDGQLKHLNRADLERAVGGVMEGNFFMVNLPVIKQVAEQMAWVDQVTIKRVWPDKLKMWVREQVPLARWGKQALVTRAGVVFTPKPEQIPDGLPLLSGPEGRASDVVEQYLQINRQVNGLGLAVVRLQMDARYAWTVEFNGGVELKLGKEAIARRLERFISLYPQLTRQSDKTARRIDLRYTNGVAVLWEEAS